jgi:hypothetical protein
MLQLRRAAIAVTKEHVATVMEILFAEASRGEVATAPLLLAYRLGPPARTRKLDQRGS